LGTAASVYNYPREQDRIRWNWLVYLAIFCIATLMLASAFTVSRIIAGKIRHVLPTTIGLSLIWVMLLHQVYLALRHITTNSNRLIRTVPLLVPIIVLLVYLPAFAVETTQLILNYRKTYVNEVVWNYTDSSLPREGLVWLEESSVLATLWNRPWGGYPGDKPFEWWNEPPAELAAQTPEELVERNITHLIFTNKDKENRMNTPEMDALLDKMLLVKTIPAPQGVYLIHNDVLDGVEEVYVYRVMPPQHTVDVPFGDAIRMVGYDLSADTVAAGDTLQMRLFWQAAATPPIDYSMFIHVYPADSLDIVTQYDSPPVSVRRGTSTWDDPNEIYISDLIQLTLPEDLPAGDYRLAIGLYDFNNGQRLPTTDENGFHPIPITVTN